MNESVKAKFEALWKLFGITSFGSEDCGLESMHENERLKAEGRCDEQTVAKPGFYANARAWVLIFLYKGFSMYIYRSLGI